MAQVQRVDDRRTRTADAVALFWVVLWLVVGVAVSTAMFRLADLGDSLSQSGRALDSSGRALQELRDLPLVGDRTGAVADEVRATAADLVASGQRSRAAGRRLAVLIGLTTCLVPAGPVLLLYVPARLRRHREREQLLVLLGTGTAGRDLDRDVEALLAHRALLTASWAELRRAGAAPEADYRAGRHRALADVELARMGLQRTGS